MDIKTIKQLRYLKSKRVLLRCDFNVPIKKGKVMDDYKIKKSLPTIEYLLKKGSKIILLTHLGRPDGKKVAELSVKPIRNYLQKALNLKIKLHGLDRIKNINLSEDISMIENVRFSPDEKNNTGTFAKELSALATIFVIDGFAVAHRPSATVLGVAKHLPTYAGLLMAEEIKGLSKLMKKPRKPYVAILGGVKMETKIPVIKNLLSKANYILIGGALMNTFLYAKGYYIGKSRFDASFKKQAKDIMKKRKVILPIDFVVGTKDGKKHEVVEFKDGYTLKRNWAIYDIGPKTISLYAQYIKKAQTIVWNGAMGYFEQHPYQYGTKSIAELVVSRSKGRAYTVAGGGETVELLRNLKLDKDIDLLSTGGGALLEFLSGKVLPGVKILKK